MKKIQKNIFIVLGVIFLLLIGFIIYFFIFKPFNSSSSSSNMSTDKEVSPSDLITTTTAPTTTDTTSSTLPTITPPAITSTSPITSTSTVPEPEEDNDKHPFLNESQEEILESFGVDVSRLPKELTPEMEECFIEKLGEQRVNEIIGGAEPNLLDFLKAGPCLNI